jgi:hypothetical protein
MKRIFYQVQYLLKQKYNSIALDRIDKRIKTLQRRVQDYHSSRSKNIQAERRLPLTSGGGIDGLLNSISGRIHYLKVGFVIEKSKQPTIV